MQETQIWSLGWKDPLEKEPAPIFLPGKSHGQRSLVGYSPWGRKRVRHDLATKQEQDLPGSWDARRLILRLIFQSPAGPQNFPRKFENKNKQKSYFWVIHVQLGNQVSKLRPGMGLGGIGSPQWAWGYPQSPRGWMEEGQDTQEWGVSLFSPWDSLLAHFTHEDSEQVFICEQETSLHG